METIILGGGCFWCTESVFRSIHGVVQVTPGYCGGHVDNPTYEQVCGMQTGHVEVVQVRFDPELIMLEQLLAVFFATHDPTTLDRQGGDVGPQYASAIFYTAEAQRSTIERVLAEAQKALAMPIVTRVLKATRFWPAESHHHDYYRKNPGQAYCQLVIAPKLMTLRQRFSELLTQARS